ncbi:MAG: cysteine desulfurase family protein [Eubacteriales bacterium]
MIYFDNSATSPIDEEVLETMLPYLKEEYGNPSSKYYCKAVNAKNAVEDARRAVAKLLGAKEEEIIFTAGATESTNFIIKGYMDYRRYYGDGKNHIITSKVEHKATLNTCKFLAGELYSNDDPTISLLGDRKKVNRGYEASFVDVSLSGEILADNIFAAIRDNTALISVLYVNNEIGTISDIKSIARIGNKKGIAIHADLTQAIGKVPVNVNNLKIDFASCSAHKIYGPKGIGAAYLKSDLYGIPPISSFMHGGEQEQGLRAGTLSVHNIIGFGKAAEISLKDQEITQNRIKLLDEYAVNKLLELPDIYLTNPMSNRVSGIISIIVDKTDFHNERFIKQISDEIALSTGSACSAGEPSYVIRALGLENKVSKVLRITLNKFSCEEEVDHLVKIIKKYS